MRILQPMNAVAIVVVMIGMVVSLSSSSSVVDAFVVPHTKVAVSSSVSSATASTTTTTLYGKSRKARRLKEKQSRGRSVQFYEAIEDAQGKTTTKKKKQQENEAPTGPTATAAAAAVDPMDQDSLLESTQIKQGRRDRMLEDAKNDMEQRPPLSTMIVDEDEDGGRMEYIQQGQSVLDVVTRKAVQLSTLGPQYRLAQMFPGVPPEIREKYRFQNVQSMTGQEMMDQFKEACYIKLPDGGEANGSVTRRGVPPRPSVTNRAIDFIIANRDLLGEPFSRMLGRVSMRAAWQQNSEQTKELKALWEHYALLQNHVSAPFRQILQDAEGRVGPNFGNLDLQSFCGGQLYERIGNYVVLKGMVAHWEQKVIDADYIEKTPQTQDNFMTVLGTGDPRRYLGDDSPILFTLRECTQVCAMAQTMCQQFVDTPEFFQDFPPEIVFLEEALKIRGGTALRKYMIDEFCPARGITPEGLREGMRRFHAQLSSMQIDPYGDLTQKVYDLIMAMSVGTEDEKLLDPFKPYLGMKSITDPNSPGYFESYTTNFPKQSIVSFLDSTYPSVTEVNVFDLAASEKNDALSSSSNRRRNDDNPFDVDLGSIFGFEQEERTTRTAPTLNDVDDDGEIPFYKTPVERAMGRPHMLGWMEKLNADPEDGKKFRLGEMPPGRIIPDDECD